MALIPCKECSKEIGSTAKSCPHCGTEQILNSSETNIKTSLIAFFFGPIYYAGYGEIKKGTIMQLISFIPFLSLIVAFYSLFNYKKDLKVKKIPFKWGNAFVVIVINIIEIIIWGFIQIAKENKNIQSTIIQFIA